MIADDDGAFSSCEANLYMIGSLILRYATAHMLATYHQSLTVSEMHCLGCSEKQCRYLVASMWSVAGMIKDC